LLLSLVKSKKYLKCCKSYVSHIQTKKEWILPRERVPYLNDPEVHFLSISTYRAPSVTTKVTLSNDRPLAFPSRASQRTSVCMPFPKPVARETRFALLAALRSNDRGGSLPSCDHVFPKDTMPTWITREQFFFFCMNKTDSVWVRLYVIPCTSTVRSKERN
jgi:hypothetical protein